MTPVSPHCGVACFAAVPLQADIDSAWRSAWAQATDLTQQQAVSAKASLQRISGKASVMLFQAMHKQQSKLPQQQQQRMLGAGGAASYAGSSVGGGMGPSGAHSTLLSGDTYAPGRGLHTE
jgi:hypothetical protein